MSANQPPAEPDEADRCIAKIIEQLVKTGFAVKHGGTAADPLANASFTPAGLHLQAALRQLFGQSGRAAVLIPQAQLLEPVVFLLGFDLPTESPERPPQLPFGSN